MKNIVISKAQNKKRLVKNISNQRSVSDKNSSEDDIPKLVSGIDLQTSNKKNKRKKNKSKKLNQTNNQFFRVEEKNEVKYIVIKGDNLRTELRNIPEFSSVDSLYERKPHFISMNYISNYCP